MTETIVIPAKGGQRRGPRPGLCTACKHPERARAELLLAGGASIQSVADKFGIPYQALRRHWQKHVSEGMKRMLSVGPCKMAELGAKLTDENLSVLDHLRLIRGGLYAMFDNAVEARDRNGTAILAGRLHENLSAMAKLTGELSQSPAVVLNQQNIFMLPAVAELQAALLNVLSRHPDARVAVIAAFREMEQRMAAPQIDHVQA